MTFRRACIIGCQDGVVLHAMVSALSLCFEALVSTFLTDKHDEKFTGNYSSSFIWWDIMLSTQAGKTQLSASDNREHLDTRVSEDHK